MFVNHYEILGVEHDADLVQIAAARKRLLKKYHPDLNRNDQDAHEQAILINKAYEVLSDTARRKKFDQQLEKRQRNAESCDDPLNDGDAQGPAAGNSQPFSTSSQRGGRLDRQATALTALGITLGLLTAFPIGLFLVWAISGFDPLGIFREKNQEVVENQNQVEAQPEIEEKQQFNKPKIGDRTPDQVASIEETKEDARNAGESANPENTSSSGIDSNSPKNQTVASEPKVVQPSKNGEAIQSLPEVSIGTKSATKDKMAIPPDEEIVAARKRIEDAFKQRFQEINSVKGLERFQKLRELSGDVYRICAKENKPADLFALYQVAVEAGRDSCFAIETLQIANEFASRFEIDGQALRLELFRYWREQLPTAISDAVARIGASYRLAILCETYFARAIADHEWKAAAQLAELLRLFYATADDNKEQLRYAKLVSTLTRLDGHAAKVQNAVQELKKSPEDSEKNFLVGTYYCFQLGEWNTGLPFLEKCNKPELARCAREDLAAQQTSQYLGDLWWNLASVEEFREFRSGLITRAGIHYKLAIGNSKGIQREIFKKRISEADRQTSELLAGKKSLVPPAAVQFKGHAYLAVHQDGIDWKQARLLCQKMGGELACINSKEEAAFLHQLLGDKGERNVWVGADFVKGSWQWIDGSEVGDSIWHAAPIQKTGHSYAYFSSLGTIWNSNSPRNTIPGFICEWTLSAGTLEKMASSSVSSKRDLNVAPMVDDKRALDPPAAVSRFQGRSYLVIHMHRIDWNQAREICQKMGGKLVTIESKAEARFLHQLVGVIEGRNYWVGAHAVDGNWRWIDESGINDSIWHGPPIQKADHAFAYFNSLGTIWNCPSPFDTIPGFICEWDH